MLRTYRVVKARMYRVVYLLSLSLSLCYILFSHLNSHTPFIGQFINVHGRHQSLSRALEQYLNFRNILARGFDASRFLHPPSMSNDLCTAVKPFSDRRTTIEPRS